MIDFIVMFLFLVFMLYCFFYFGNKAAVELSVEKDIIISDYKDKISRLSNNQLIKECLILSNEINGTPKDGRYDFSYLVLVGKYRCALGLIDDN